MKHQAWDDGVISGIFGAALGQKTIKTRCGKRVAFASVVDNNQPDCPECLAAIEKDKQAAVLFGLSLDQIQNRGAVKFGGAQ